MSSQCSHLIFKEISDSKIVRTALLVIRCVTEKVLFIEVLLKKRESPGFHVSFVDINLTKLMC
jgi:hypothetical protein